MNQFHGYTTLRIQYHWSVHLAWLGWKILCYGILPWFFKKVCTIIHCIGTYSRGFDMTTLIVLDIKVLHAFCRENWGVLKPLFIFFLFILYFSSSPFTFTHPGQTDRQMYCLFLQHTCTLPTAINNLLSYGCWGYTLIFMLILNWSNSDQAHLTLTL